MDNGGKINIINILNLILQPNQNPLVFAVLGDNYKNRTYVHFNPNLLVSKIITIMLSNEASVLKYPKHDVKLDNNNLPQRSNKAENPPTPAERFHVRVGTQGETPTLVAIPVLLPLYPATKIPPSGSDANTISLNENYDISVRTWATAAHWLYANNNSKSLDQTNTYLNHIQIKIDK